MAIPLPQRGVINPAESPVMSGSTTRDKTDGEIFDLISRGGFSDTLMGMPRFRGLLSPTDRWLLVHYLRSLQGQ